MDPENLESEFEIGQDDSEIDAAFAEAFRRASDTETPAEVTPAEEAAAPETQETQAEEQTPVESEEPEDELASFLAKYDGDPEKALRGALELSKLQGRQADELGQLRQEIAEIRQAQQTAPETPAPQVPQIPITAELIESLDAAALENPRAAMEQAAQIDPSGQLVSRVLDTWYAVNPREATAFQTSLMLRQQEERIRSEYEPLVQKDQQSEADRAFVDSWNAAGAAVAKVGGDLNALAPQIEKFLEGNEALAKAIVAAETVDERAALIKTAHDLVAVQTAGEAARQKELEVEAQRQEREAETASKKIARVIKPSAVGATPGGAPETEQTEDDRIKAGILGAATTDIQSGLTYE